MKEYKVAFLTSHPIQYQAPLFKKLAKQPEINLIVYFCTDFGIKEKVDPEFGKKIKWDTPLLEGYKYKFLKNYSFKPNYSFLGQINFGIIKELYKNKFDAIIIHGWNSLTNILAIFFAKIFGIKVFLISENPLSQEKLKPKWKILVKKIFIKNILFNLIDIFLYIGEENKKFYRFYNVEDKKLFFYPYSVNNDFFQKEYEKYKSKRIEIRKELTIGQEDIVILFVGKLINKKNPLDLLKAYEILKQENKALIFVGEGGLRREMEKYIEEKKLKKVIITGFVNQSEISKYYSIADIFVLPSGIGETWGLVVNEAMCFGLSILASTIVGCSGDLVKKDINGYTFSVGNIKEIAYFLDILASNGYKRNEFKKNSFKLIRLYSYEEDIKGILNALKFLKNKDL